MQPLLRLNVTHTHAGRVHLAGQLIEVDDHTARWLIDRGIANLAIPDDPATPVIEPAPEPVPVAETAPAPAPAPTRSAKPAKE